MDDAVPPDWVAGASEGGLRHLLGQLLMDLLADEPGLAISIHHTELQAWLQLHSADMAMQHLTRQRTEPVCTCRGKPSVSMPGLTDSWLGGESAA